MFVEWSVTDQVILLLVSIVWRLVTAAAAAAVVPWGSP